MTDHAPVLSPESRPLIRPELTAMALAAIGTTTADTVGIARARRPAPVAA